ncbi:hypothetical protein RB195_007916 [Necator americanus]|uniref:Cytochrome oxidase c subunit VIb n=1 Tax=Necator americanus TaxID=51031 RepID=A0ABR1C0P8_NECAM
MNADSTKRSEKRRNGVGRTVMSEGGKSTALKKDRQRCHQARDEYLECVDKGLDAGKTEDQASRACRAELKTFRGSCPASWQIKMLSAIKRINIRVLWAPSRIRDLSNAASKPPRRRKSVAAKKIPLQSYVDIGVDPPLSLPIKEGVLKEKSLNDGSIAFQYGTDYEHPGILVHFVIGRGGTC